MRDKLRPHVPCHVFSTDSWPAVRYIFLSYTFYGNDRLFCTVDVTVRVEGIDVAVAENVLVDR